MSTSPLRLAAVAAAVALCACKNEAVPAAAAPPAPPVAAVVPAAPPAGDATAQAKEIFATRCTPCHGPNGAGDGPASAGLTPKPANFSSPDWQKSVTDDHIQKIIVYGGMAVGKSAAMPPNPDLDAKPDVVQALRAQLRGMKK